MASEERALRVYLIAGEPSGDALGGPLMSRLKEERPDAAFTGVGGPLMMAEGLQSLFPMEELSIMGLAEVLPRLPGLIRRIRETARDIERQRPDIVVTIDSPDFTLRVAKKVRRLGIPLVHYVAPTVWAWRPGRAAGLAGIVDHVMALFPFEPPYFEAVGLDATFVGHPIAEEAVQQTDRAAFRRAHGISESAQIIACLPGSRRGEIGRLLPVFRETVERLRTGRSGKGGLHVVLPTLTHLAPELARETASWPVPVSIEADRARFVDTLQASDVALCASGTVVLELAKARLPAVVAYRVNRLSAAIARRLIRVDHVSLVNIVAGRQIMPEHLQENCTAARLAGDVATLLESADARQRQIDAFDSVLDALRPDGMVPSLAAARAVLSSLRPTS